MPQCAILSCNNTHRKTRGASIRYHRFPGDPCTRSLWIRACGRQVNNCATARVCSLHFSESSYERDVQHELLGLPIRCRLKKGVLPELNLPSDPKYLEKKAIEEQSEIAVLLAVGLIPADFGGRLIGHPSNLNKMHIMEDVPEVTGAQATQMSSPIHNEQIPDIATLDESSNSPQHNGDNTQSNGIDDEIKPKLEKDLIMDDTSNHSGEKRKLEGETEDATVKKRMRSDLEQNFILRDKILNDYVDSAACTSVQQVEYHMDQVLSEIKMLNELAFEKEKEWNNIIHLKKIKEELLLRIQRRKQVMLLNTDHEDALEPQPDILKNIKTNNGLMIFSSNPGKKMPNKSHLNTFMELTNGYSKVNLPQRPVIDVQSIIADYRQRHPEAVPRRGRRIRSLLNAQGSGAHVKHNLSTPSIDANGNVSVLLTGHDFDHQDIPHPSGKPPPPYSEVTVHPVIPMSTQSSNSSLLHGILTKTHSKTENTKSTYSPTLARLLTAPEQRLSSDPSQLHSNAAASLSISDMLSNNKARNEITITPVGGQFDMTVKDKVNVNEDDIEDASDRLVIDESDSTEVRNGIEELVDDVPQCQGCNQKAAQFVCAGCGNQWYCSRECQVVAWDEHSEVCSG